MGASSKCGEEKQRNNISGSKESKKQRSIGNSTLCSQNKRGQQPILKKHFKILHACYIYKYICLLKTKKSKNNTKL